VSQQATQEWPDRGLSLGKRECDITMERARESEREEDREGPPRGWSLGRAYGEAGRVGKSRGGGLHWEGERVSA
jgi:hypothetical protein